MVQAVIQKSVKQARGAFEPRMIEGGYLDRHGRAGALLVMTREGILRGS